MGQKHKEQLVDNRLRKIENRLRRIEIILLKSVSSGKKIKKELDLLEKEEKSIEKEQKKLETEENQILKEMKNVEEEERWHIHLQYNCKLKVMDNENIIKCDKTGKLCELPLCPKWKK